MEGNVFLIDSKYLNKFILTSALNQIESKVVEELPIYEISSEHSQESNDTNSQENGINEISVTSIVRKGPRVLVPGEGVNTMEIVGAQEEQPSILGEQNGVESAPVPATLFPCAAPTVASLRGSKIRVIETKEKIVTPINYVKSLSTVQGDVINQPTHFILNQTSLPETSDGEICLEPRILQQPGIFPAKASQFGNRLKKWKPFKTPSVDSYYSKERYSIYSGTGSRLKRTKIDKAIMIPSHIFKRQLMDSSDITLARPDLAAVGREALLHYQKINQFSSPSRKTCTEILHKYSRNCITAPEACLIDTDTLGLLPVGYQIPIDKSKLKRITRRRRNPYARNNVIIKQDEARDLFILPERDSQAAIQLLMLDGEGGEECYFISEHGQDESQQVIVISEEQHEAVPSKSGMEVLLAAAEGQDLHEGQIFCQDSAPDCHMPQNIFPSNNQIIFTLNHDND